jgi:phosphoenolpyruvate carboxykinase (ATP)
MACFYALYVLSTLSLDLVFMGLVSILSSNFDLSTREILSLLKPGAMTLTTRPLTTLSSQTTLHYNLPPSDLTARTLAMGEGKLTHNGVLTITTGRFTGRSPKDRYIVRCSQSQDLVDWGAINQPVSAETFDQLKAGIIDHLSGGDVYVQDGYACADPSYSLSVRVVAEKPWSAMFAHNMFNRPSDAELATLPSGWQVYCAPGYHAPAGTAGLGSTNFSIISFEHKEIIIGGTGYTGEIKKGIFSVLNLLLPTERQVLPMHCSANVGSSGDTALFFGLSGTGKTTLSTDADRQLVGDDEHGWSDRGVFNFEGGCYAKCINLSADKEPEIFQAIKPGALLENVVMDDQGVVDYDDTSITQNTRVSYPIHHIDNIRQPSTGGIPRNIFFLTCDAFGVLPPISRLTRDQAMYHFLSGYTAKVAGTEDGVKEPTATFSSGFGAPFLPLHPTAYAEMLGDKMDQHETKVWLVNTGWIGGGYGLGSRIKLKYTRAMINAALKGHLDNVQFVTIEPFGLQIPTFCPHVPIDILNPRSTWLDQSAYMDKANYLATLFADNFEQYEQAASPGVRAAAPHILEYA